MQSTGGGQEEHLIVARVRRPHGIRGEFHVAVDTDRPRHVFQPGRVLALGDAQGAPIGRAVTIESLRRVPTGALLRCREIASRAEAEELRGRTLLIATGEALPAAGGEVHYRHLMGLEARTAAEVIGRVEALLELPGGLTLGIRSPEGREILVPFVREMVRRVDLEEGVLELVLPEGLLEL